MVLSWPCEVHTERWQPTIGIATVWQVAIAGIAVACLAGTSSAAPITDVSSAELANYRLLYQLPIPSSFNFNSVPGIAGVPYSVDTTGDIVPGSFTRVAYYMELQSTAVGAQRYWVWASMDTPSTNPLMLGVPNAGTNIVYNGTIVTNLYVESNHPNITSGSFDNGNLEFWASNYGGNGGGALGSNDSHYDWRDGGGTTSAGHGSMQVFNYSLKQTLFGFNGLNQSGRMGIGNQNTPGTGDTDWTFGPGASTFSIRNLEIWVNPPASDTYTWDGLGDGEWTASRWAGSGYPNEGVNAVVQSNTVTVNGNQSARTLTVNSGGVAIGPGSSLAVAAINAIRVEAGGLMTLDGGTTGASLIATNGGGSISSLVLNGQGTVSNATQLTIGTFSDGGAAATLTKQGAGDLVLAANTASTITSGTTFDIRAGRLVAVHNAGNNAIGAAPVTLNGGGLGLSSTAAATFDNAVAVAQNGSITAQATSPGAASQTITLGSASRGITIGNGRTVTLGTADNCTLSLGGTISGSGAVAVTGNTGVVLMSLANDYTGQTTVLSGGRLAVANAGALGTTAAGTVVQSGGQLRLQNGVTIAAAETITIAGDGPSTEGALRNQSGNNTVENLMLGGTARITSNSGTLSIPNGLNVNHAVTFDGGSTTSVAGVVTGSAAIHKAGAGLLTLSNAANSFSGQLNISGGRVQVTADGQLGTAAGGTVVAVGGTLEISGGVHYATPEAVSIAGTGASSLGAINSVGGDNRLDGPITLLGSATINSGTAGGKLTLGGAVAMPTIADLAFTGAGDIDVVQGFGNGGGSITTSALMATLYTGTVEADIINIGNGTGTGGVLAKTPAAVSLLTGVLDFSNDFGKGFPSLGTSWRGDNFSVLWQGTLTAPSDGSYQFQITGLDDRGRIWIDLDQDGKFEDTEALGATAGAELLASANNGAGTRTLVGGQQYQVAFAFHEFTGTEAYEARIQITNSTNNLSNRLVNPSEAAQTALWQTSFEKQNAVTKSGTGTVTLRGDNSHNGLTTINGGTLVAAHDNALGTTDAGTIVKSGVLALEGGVTIPAGETLTLGDRDYSQSGTLQNRSGANTYRGNVNLGGKNATIDSQADTLTITGPITMGGSNLVVDGAGQTVLDGDISGVNLATIRYEPGLLAGHITGTSMSTAANPGNHGIVLSPEAGLTNVAPPWADYRTWVYTGQFYDADGVFSFGENIDDVAWMKIDGDVRMDNGSWSTPTTTGILNLGMGVNGDGWHDVEIRFFNGSGGAGAVAGNGWTTTKGFGLNINGTTSTNGADYPNSVTDPGTGSLWRYGIAMSPNDLIKTGTGTLTLSGANTYVGTTTVQQGTLLVNGSHVGGGAYTVQNGGTLGGSGVIGSAVAVQSGGMLSPGVSPGVLAMQSLSLEAGSTTLMEIDGLARGTEHDGVDITAEDGLAYGGSLLLDFGNTTWLEAGAVLDLFNFTGTATGAFSEVTSTGFYAGEWAPAGGGVFSLESGWQTLLFSHATGDLTVVPEPAAWLMLLCAAACSLLVRRRK